MRGALSQRKTSISEVTTVAYNGEIISGMLPMSIMKAA